MRPSSRPPRHDAHRALWLCLLSLALWCSQSLGLVHAVLHAGGLQAHGGAAGEDAQASGHGVEKHARLFAHQQGSADCHAFDALTHGDALAMGSPPSLFQAALALLDVQPPSGRVAPQASGFLARGPPVSPS